MRIINMRIYKKEKPAAGPKPPAPAVPAVPAASQKELRLFFYRYNLAKAVRSTSKNLFEKLRADFRE